MIQHHKTEQPLLNTCDIEWEDWIEVVVHNGCSTSEGKHHSSLSADFNIQVNRIKRGINPLTQELITIDQHGHIVSFPNPETVNLEVDKEENGWINKQQTTSYLINSEANMQKVEGMIESMVNAKEHFSSFLKQSPCHLTS